MDVPLISRNSGALVEEFASARARKKSRPGRVPILRCGQPGREGVGRRRQDRTGQAKRSHRIHEFYLFPSRARLCAVFVRRKNPPGSQSPPSLAWLGDVRIYRNTVFRTVAKNPSPPPVAQLLSYKAECLSEQWLQAVYQLHTAVRERKRGRSVDRDEWKERSG